MMYADISPSAPLSVLLFLGTLAAGGIALIILVYGIIKKKIEVRKLALRILAGLAILYAGVVLLFSFLSKENLLSQGTEKHFCEVDCHIAYSVSGIQKITSQPDGVLYNIDVRMHFDESTISPHRGNSALTPNSRFVEVLDEAGNRYPISSRIETSDPDFSKWQQPLRPGESKHVSVYVRLPAELRRPRLFITSSPHETFFLAGHENSPFHKKTYFVLDTHPI